MELRPQDAPTIVAILDDMATREPEGLLYTKSIVAAMEFERRVRESMGKPGSAVVDVERGVTLDEARFQEFVQAAQRQGITVEAMENARVATVYKGDGGYVATDALFDLQEKFNPKGKAVGDKNG